MSHADDYLAETGQISVLVDADIVERLVAELAAVRARNGRLFILGLGGSAANASHAVNDFRKLCGLQAFCPSDNVAELTARANDEGWNSIYSDWLRASQANVDDAILVLSVGGGSGKVSLPLVTALAAAKLLGMRIYGIVGRDGGYTGECADCCVIVPTVNEARVTPHTEGWQSVVLHCVVSHPDLQRNSTKW